MRLKRIHPRTGEELAPLFYTRDGRPVWNQMGAAPDDPDAGDGDGGEDDDDGADDGTGGTGDDAGDDDGKGGDEPVTKAELEAVVRRMKAADKRASDAENKLKKIEDGKKDELTKATERAETAEKRVAELEARVLDADVRDAFGQVEGVAWKKPAVALRIARADGYLDEVVNDGEIDTKLLAKKVGEFAKAYPELLRGKESGSNGDGPPPPSGQPAGSGRKNPSRPDDKAVKERYGHLLK
jgi:hypothetical protein